MRRFAPLVAVLAFGQLMAGCHGHALGSGEGRLTADSAQVASAGGGWHRVHGSRTLHAGERVRILDGEGKIVLSAGRSIELRQGSTVELQRAPVLLSGDLLAVARQTPLTISSAGTNARVTQGAAHISRALAVVTASYAGSVRIDSAGRSMDVPALRQAGVALSGLLPPRPVPLIYDTHNPWDRRFLGDAIELGDELAARSQGFTAQLAPDEGHTAGFYRDLLPDLRRESSFDQPLLNRDLTPGETLVGAAITVQGRRGGFVHRWESVFGFRAEGARWGLVALDQRVVRAPLLSSVDQALGRAAPSIRSTNAQAAAPAPAPAEVAPPPPGPAPTTAPSPSPSPTVKPGGSTTTTRPQNPLPIPLPTTSTTQPGGGPVGGLLGGLTNTVGDVLGGLLNPRR